MITVIIMNNSPYDSYYNHWFSSGCWGSYGDWGIGVIMVLGMIMKIEDSYRFSNNPPRDYLTRY